MNIAGLVILYNPDKDLIQRISTYKNALKKVYIIDNSQQSHLHLVESVFNDAAVSFIHDGQNKGIGTRLNQAAKLAIDEKYDWLLTMDQDSFFDAASLSHYLQCASSYNNIRSTAMFGIEYDEKLLATTKSCRYKNINHLITSGSLVNLQLFLEIGGFNEDFFIDHVDHEYCFRAVLKGYKIVLMDNILLHHSIGTVSYHRSLKNFKLTPRALHSPIRIYYMVRNYLQLNKVYSSSFKEEMTLFKKHLLNRIKNNLLYNKKRGAVIKYVFKGIMDYQKIKMGRHM